MRDGATTDRPPRGPLPFAGLNRPFVRFFFYAALLAAVFPVVGQRDGKVSEGESSQVEFVQVLPACVQTARRHGPVGPGRGTFVRLTRCWMLAAHHEAYLPHTLGHCLPSGSRAPLRC